MKKLNDCVNRPSCDKRSHSIIYKSTYLTHYLEENN